MKTLPEATESQEQAALVQWLRLRRVPFFAVPNGAVLGGANHYAILGRLKAEGMLNGAPDLVLIQRAPTTGRHVMVEMKRRVGGKLTPEQKVVHRTAQACGWDVVVAWGCESAINQLRELGF